MYKSKGSITVFLSAVLAVVITFVGCMVDYARIKMAEALVVQACEAVAYSVMSGYSKDLEESYGLLSLYNGALLESKEDIACRVLQNNLNIYGAKGMNLYDFHMEHLSVIPMYHFLYPETIKSQVVDFMKYRAPVEVVHSIFDHLDLISRMGDTIEGMNIKIKFEKEMYKIEKSLIRLELLTDKLSKFNRERSDGLSWLQAYKTLCVLRINAECCQFIRNQLQHVDIRLDDDLSTLKKKIDNLNGLAKTLTRCGACNLPVIRIPEISDDADLEDINKIIREVHAETVNLEVEIERFSRDLDVLYNNLHSEVTDKLVCYIYDCDDAVTLCNEISVKAQEAVSLAKEGIKQLQQDKTLVGQDMKLEFEKALKSLRADDTGTIKTNIQANKNTLVQMLTAINSIPQDAQWFFQKAGTTDTDLILRQGGEKIEFFRKLIEEYKDKDIMFRYGQRKEQDSKELESADSSSDPRTKVKSGLKQVASKEDQNEYVVIGKKKGESEGKIDALPSRLMKILSEQVVSFFNEEPDFSEDNSEGTPEKGLTAASNLFNGLKDIMRGDWDALIDEIYFNEYVLQTMKNAVTGSKDAGKKAEKAGKGDMVRKDYLDIRGNLLASGNSYFKKGEVEYILVGNVSEAVNLSAVKSEILAIRFAMNLLGAYMDKSKSALASSIALSMAGWTVVGVPLLKTLIMCSWALAESIIDINKLTDGKKVPFYKTDFYLDFGLSDIGKTLENVIGEATTESLEHIEKNALDKGKDLIYRAAENVVDQYLLEKGFYTVSDNLYQQLERRQSENATDSAGLTGDENNKGIQTSEDSIFRTIQNMIYEWLQDTYNQQIDSITDKINDVGDGIKKAIMENLEYQLGEDNPIGLYRKITDYLKSINMNLADIAGSAIGSLMTFDVYVDSTGQGSPVNGTSMLPLSYNDYLRILLLLQGSENIIYRTLDMIQLNMQIKDKEFFISNQNTYLMVEAEVSIPYLFPTGLFINDALKDKEKKRHLIKVKIMKGY